MSERIRAEVALLGVGGQRAAYFPEPAPGHVVYYDVPTGCGLRSLPETTDVLVPVPSGYPAAVIDLAGLPAGSPFLPLVPGGPNNQGMRVVDGRNWQLASYHPHGNGGGPAWDQMKHGFHTYIDHLIAWFRVLT